MNPESCTFRNFIVLRLLKSNVIGLAAGTDGAMSKAGLHLGWDGDGASSSTRPRDERPSRFKAPLDRVAVEYESPASTAQVVAVEANDIPGQVEVAGFVWVRLNGGESGLVEHSDGVDRRPRPGDEAEANDATRHGELGDAVNGPVFIEQLLDRGRQRRCSQGVR